jgi:hypothetical protein
MSHNDNCKATNITYLRADWLKVGPCWYTTRDEANFGAQVKEIRYYGEYQRDIKVKVILLDDRWIDFADFSKIDFVEFDQHQESEAESLQSTQHEGLEKSVNLKSEESVEPKLGLKSCGFCKSPCGNSWCPV